MLGAPLCRCRQRNFLPAFWLEDEIFSVMGFSPRTEPGRPTELPFLSEARPAHFIAGEHRYYLAIELEAEPVAHPVPEREQVALARQKSLVTIEVHGSDSNPHLALHIAHALSDDNTQP